MSEVLGHAFLFCLQHRSFRIHCQCRAHKEGTTQVLLPEMRHAFIIIVASLLPYTMPIARLRRRSDPRASNPGTIAPSQRSWVENGTC
ncbi:hypothetical protein BDV06DRAFT_192624 [Aspergillus oleicola]